MFLTHIMCNYVCLKFCLFTVKIVDFLYILASICLISLIEVCKELLWISKCLFLFLTHLCDNTFCLKYRFFCHILSNFGIWKCNYVTRYSRDSLSLILIIITLLIMHFSEKKKSSFFHANHESFACLEKKQTERYK